MLTFLEITLNYNRICTGEGVQCITRSKLGDYTKWHHYAIIISRSLKQIINHQKRKHSIRHISTKQANANTSKYNKLKEHTHIPDEGKITKGSRKYMMKTKVSKISLLELN